MATSTAQALVKGLSINSSGNAVVNGTPVKAVTNSQAVAPAVKPLVMPSGLSAADQAAVAAAYSAGGGSTSNITRTSSAPPAPPPASTFGLTGAQATAYNTAASLSPSYTPPPVQPTIQYTTDPVKNAEITKNFTAGSTNTTTPVDTMRANLIQNQANTAQTNPLNDPSSPLAANLKSATDAYSTLKSKIAAQFGTMERGDEALPTVLGREGALAKQYAGQLDALATNVNTAQTAMSQAVAAYNAQTGAQNAVTTQTQPSNQFTLVSPGNYLADSTGNAAGGGQLTGIQNATKWAIAQQNISQGQDHQAAADNLSNAIQTMSPIGQKLTDFITATGQNPEFSPILNKKISEVNAQTNPAQVATLNAAVNDIRSYAIQILGSQSGANPTDVTNAVSSFDFGQFSAINLRDFLQDLNNLGMTRLQQQQSSSAASYNANLTGGGLPAQGITATDQGAFNTGTLKPAGVIMNALKGTTAVGVGIVDSAGNAISNVGGQIVGATAAHVLGI